MKRVTGFFLSFFFGVMLLSCGLYKDPISTDKAYNNPAYKVDYLFEHDGCKVYRFMDDGKYVYFTNCTGNVTSMAGDSTSNRVVTITHKNVDNR